MKTVIGFMCGIAGMMLSIVAFITGCLFGYQLNEHATAKKKTNPADTYAEWLRQIEAQWVNKKED